LGNIGVTSRYTTCKELCK